MLSKKITLINKYGLHARAAAKFVSTASRFLSEVTVQCNDKSANGKSIMDVMMLAAVCNNAIEIKVNGEDETELLVALEKLVSERFGEKE